MPANQAICYGPDIDYVVVTVLPPTHNNNNSNTDSGTPTSEKKTSSSSSQISSSPLPVGQRLLIARDRCDVVAAKLRCQFNIEAHLKGSQLAGATV
jgi:isoleucyl-tRNA synthetase